MQNFTIRLPAWLAAATFLLVGVSALADETGTANAHAIDGQVALEQQDYLKAAREFALAAQMSDSVEFARKATSVATSYGFDHIALPAAERWYELDDESDEALFYLARLQLRTGDIRKARRSYRALLERGDGDPDERLISLIGVLGEEDADTADKVMRWLARPYKKSAAAHYAAAVMAIGAGDIAHAQERAQRAMELEPGWNRAELLYARTMLLEGRTDEAIDYVARMIGDDTQPNPEARMELAIMMMGAGRDDDALSQVNQIQYETGQNPDALRLMAILNFRKQHFDAAQEDFEDLLASGRHTMDAMYYLARIADFRGQTDRAIRLYSQVNRGGNVIASQRRAAALIAFQGEGRDAAFEQLDEFADNSQSHAIDVVQIKAQILASLEEYDDALFQYDRLIEYRPEDEGVMLGRGELLLRMGRLDAAVAQYEQAVDRYPDSPISLNALGYTLADRTERYDDAERYIRKALEFDAENAAIIDSLGWVLFKKGQHEAALVELRRAYEQLKDPEVAAHIVEVLAVLERRDEALEFLVAAEERTPENPLLKNVRERIFPEDD